jgi:hypothetical protein
MGCLVRLHRSTLARSAWFSIWTRLWCIAPSRYSHLGGAFMTLVLCRLMGHDNRFSSTSICLCISYQLIPQADYVVPVEIDNQSHNVYVIKRPGVDTFLQKMGELYEVVIFTASLSKVLCEGYCNASWLYRVKRLLFWLWLLWYCPFSTRIQCSTCWISTVSSSIAYSENPVLTIKETMSRYEQDYMLKSTLMSPSWILTNILLIHAL